MNEDDLGFLEEKRKHNTKKNIVSYRSEVIGNKFDNPELLTKE